MPIKVTGYQDNNGDFHLLEESAVYADQLQKLNDTLDSAIMIASTQRDSIIDFLRTYPNTVTDFCNAFIAQKTIAIATMYDDNEAEIIDNEKSTETENEDTGNTD